MSKTSTKSKRRKLRKRKSVAVKDPAVRLYEKICRLYCNISKAYAIDRYVPLMQRVVEGSMPANVLAEEGMAKSWSGTVAELLGEAVDGLPYNIYLQSVSTPSRFLPEIGGMAFYRGGKLSIYSSNGLRRYSLSDDDVLYCSVINVEQLPADMRKWTEEQRITFLLWKNQGVHLSQVGNQELTPYGLIRKPVTEKLHQLRRINGYPSRMQRRRIQRESQSLSNLKIEDKFSLEQ